MVRLPALFLLSVALILSQSLASKLPKNWRTCKKDDPGMNDCLRGAVEDAIHDLVNGNPSLGILPLDPMHFDALTVEKGHGPVSVELDLEHLDIIGIKDMKVDSLTTDWKVLDANISMPVVMAIGNYKIAGQILVLPIQGHGFCNLTFVGFTGKAHLEFKEVLKNDKKHYELKAFEFTFNTNDLKIRLDNLFNGDKALGDNMNIFLNENWPEIFVELRPPIAKAFGLALREVGNRLFSKVPLDQITPS